MNAIMTSRDGRGQSGSGEAVTSVAGKRKRMDACIWVNNKG